MKSFIIVFSQYALISLYHQTNQNIFLSKKINTFKKMSDDINCVFEGVAGIGGIYISNLRAAQNLQLLNKLNIKAIVTAVRGGIVQHDKSSISHLYVPADDIQSYDLSKHFQQTFAFIDSARKKTNVLVHCYAGISRSATIVIAYLLKKYNYSLQKVISMVKRRRTIINPNKGFIEQLKKQAARMGIVSKENQQPIQQVLKKRNPSSQKKRSISTYTIKRPQNQVNNSHRQGRISLAATFNPQNKWIKQQITPVTLVQNRGTQVLIQKQSQEIKKYKSNMINQSNQKGTKDLLKLKLLDDESKFYSLTSKTARQSIIHENIQVEQIPKIQVSEKNYNSVLSEKIERIEKLKLKILQSERRKKQVSSRRHQSELKQKINNGNNDQKYKYSLFPQTTISIKLGSQISSQNQKDSKASTYQTIISQNSKFSKFN